MMPIPNYASLKELAREKRAQYGVTTEALNLIVVRKIYSDEGIRIDNWKFPRTIRAAYMSDDADPSVAINKIAEGTAPLFIGA